MRGIRVIPILVDGARMPDDDDLPPSLASLARRQALELSPGRFEFDTSRILTVLDKTLAEVRMPSQAVSAEPTPPVPPPPPLPSPADSMEPTPSCASRPASRQSDGGSPTSPSEAFWPTISPFTRVEHRRAGGAAGSSRSGRSGLFQVDPDPHGCRWWRHDRRPATRTSWTAPSSLQRGPCQAMRFSSRFLRISSSRQRTPETWRASSILTPNDVD